VEAIQIPEPPAFPEVPNYSGEFAELKAKVEAIQIPEVPNHSEEIGNLKSKLEEIATNTKPRAKTGVRPTAKPRTGTTKAK
jgi:hypothetical protein